MNEHEYEQWRSDAEEALSKRYDPKDVEVVLRWFDRIKGASEYDLIGAARVNAFSVFNAAKPLDGKWNLYDSLMSRLWIYAPYILEKSYAIA